MIEIEVREDTMLRRARAAMRGEAQASPGEDKCGQMEAQLRRSRGCQRGRAVKSWRIQVLKSISTQDPAMDDDVLPPKTRPWGILAVLAVLDSWAHKRVRLILPAGSLTPAGDASNG
ncbi:hypothetical protein E4U54_004116 [Claviceps lovelessii]|nr:hypothetical protein E4U54_004116 [Claviceps lovelessii]